MEIVALSRDRITERERAYRKHLVLALAAAALLEAALLLVVPAGPGAFSAPRPRVGQPGPLRVLPEIDIPTDQDDPSRFTAAPSPATPSADFELVDVEFVQSVRPERPTVRDEAFPVPTAPPDPFQYPTFTDLAQEMRTTGHQVLAEADIHLLHLERPLYPREAVLRGEEGIVEVMLHVNTRGRVSELYVVNPGRFPLLERSAVEAMRETLFRPYAVEGNPEPFWVRIPVDFDLVD